MKVIERLIQAKVMYSIEVDRLTKYQLLQARERYRTSGAPQVSDGWIGE